MGEPLTRDGFASGHLGLAVYRLARPEEAAAALAGIAAERGPVMIEVKVPADAVAQVGQLTALGFWMVDTSVQLDAPAATLLAASSSSSDAWRVRDAEPRDREAVARVVGDNMVTSRYHLDPRIDPGRASAFKRVWATNFFAGLRGQRLIVAEDARGVGAILLVLEKGDRGVIDLIAVDPALRGGGAFAGLIHAWLAGSPQIASVLVGTQASNVRSLRAYGRLGFRVCSVAYVLHYLRGAAAAPGGAA
jgi:Acetyltransferase (GNAT) family